MKALWVPAAFFCFFLLLGIADWISDNKPLWDWNRAIRKHWTFYLDGVEIPSDDIQNHFFVIFAMIRKQNRYIQDH